MVIYSYSRLTTYEKCPQRFKFRYIDKIIPEIEKSIEAHLGKSVHHALEWLYLEIKNYTLPTLDQVIEKYIEEWEKDFSQNILIVKKDLTARDYLNKGVKFLASYYLENKPFDDNTLELEKKILLTLDEEGKYKLQGFIDRLAYNLKTGEYEIHDYKTANNIPFQEQLEKDKQLALYSLAIKDLFGQDKPVRLVWHFLAHNKKVHLTKTNQELEDLKKQTLELIKKIEATKEFPPCTSTLCNWCEYKNICPEFKLQEQH